LVVPLQPTFAGATDAATAGAGISTPDAVSAPDARSATDTQPTEGALHDIIVTASKRSESIERTPIAVTAITSDAIQQAGITTFRDIDGRVPGLVAPRQSSSQTTQTYSIRGIGEPDTFPEPAVAVYVDDVYLARTVGSLYDIPDLERVEVLRGPQGSLYGRNSSAGAIRFITKDATSDPSLYVSGTYGSYNNLEAQVRVNGPIIPDDKLNGSFSIVRHKRDGWMFDVPLDQHVNDLDLLMMRSKLKSQISDALSITFSADAMLDRSSQSYYAPVNQPNGQTGTRMRTDPDLTWAEAPPYNSTNAWGGALTVQYKINDELVLKSVSGYRGFHGKIYYDNDGTTAIKADSWAAFRQDQETEELNLNGEYDRVNFVAGLYYFRESFFNDRLNQSATSTTDNIGQILRVTNTLRTNSYAGYGQINFKLTKVFTLTAGGRYTSDLRHFHAVIGSLNNTQLLEPWLWGYDPNLYEQRYGAFANSVSVSPGAVRFSNFTPKGAIEAQWTPDTLTYFSYSKGFKSGAYDLRSTTVASASTPYKPQIVTAYELGLKTRFLDDHVITNLAVFYNDIKDLQLRATSPATSTSLGFSGIINAASGSTEGTELEVTVAPTKDVRIGAFAAYLETKYKAFTAILPHNVPGRTTLVGLDFPLSPKWQFGTNFDYKLPIKAPGAWHFSADASYESQRYFDLYNTAQDLQGPQTFVNSALSYTTSDGSLTSGIRGDNLANKRYDQRTTYIPTGSGEYPNYARAYNNPRMVNVFINKTF
jgi:iron complex outermembrane receptor protein